MKYWNYLLSERVLRRAAHLVDKDSRYDFQDSFIERQIFSHSRDDIISEIVSSLRAERYMPAPAIPVEIPKSSYSQRPGALLPYRDRVVLQAITMCIAPPLDEFLSDCVWSWRVKASLKGKTADQLNNRGLFRESDVSEFPFLKKKTVSKYIDDFEPWYALWPEFERKTLTTLRDERFEFMVFSDIAGYFENIQIDMLHSLLLRYQPGAPNTINLLIRHLKAWSGLAYDGSQTSRGIPQGNSISSFLGNFFLKPVDDYFEGNFDPKDVRYFRYMDDIRIITSSFEEARRAALALEAQIRRMKLNLQSAKTYVVPAREAISMITDRRLDHLATVRGTIVSGKSPTACLASLASIATDAGNSKGAVALKGSRPPLEGLNLRILRMWAGAHYQLNSTVPIKRMCREAIANPNYKITRDILRVARTFPRNRAAPNELWAYLFSGQAAFSYQEAELTRALKLFNAVPAAGFAWAYGKAISNIADPYLRLQAMLLLCRLPQDLPKASDLVRECMSSPDLRVTTAGILGASLDTPIKITKHIRGMGSHASNDANRLVQYIRALRQEVRPRTKLLEYIFSNPTRVNQLVFEFAPFLRFISSGSIPASKQLITFIRPALKARDISSACRLLLRFLLARCEANAALTPSLTP